jgi:acyl-CoA thioesterase-1
MGGRHLKNLVLAGLVGLVWPAAAWSGDLDIVAIGASNTSGWGVATDTVYPAVLERMLRERGLDVRVVNAGALLDTTAGMLRRIDADVPSGARIVILQPGGNDLRFFGSREARSGNIAAMVRRLQERNITPIVFDPVIPAELYQWDRIHITAAGHRWMASQMLPQVLDAIRQLEGTPAAKPSGNVRPRR